MRRLFKWGFPALVVIVAGVVAVVFFFGTGGTDPKTVENKAAGEAAKTLAAIKPVTMAGVNRSQWGQCTTETPGAHRYDYSYSIKLDAGTATPQSVIDRTAQIWQSEGYRTPSRDVGTFSADLPGQGGNWMTKIGVNNDGSLFLLVDSGCVHVSSDPKVG
jgi:hypothetical protein